MKLVYVTNSRFPSEKAQSDHVMQMCSAFAELGHEVTLVVPDRRDIVARDPFEYYGRPRTFRLERVPCVDWTAKPWTGRLGFLVQTASFVWKLLKKVEMLKPDVVYSRELFVFVWPWKGMRRVWESHSIHRSLMARWLVRKVNLIVTLTKESAKQLEGIGVESRHIFVEPDAVDPRLFEAMPSREAARSSLGIATDEVLCLYVGKFTTMGMPKGLDESIEAVKVLRAEGRKVRLLAVGGTHEELRRYSVKTEEGITCLGHQPQAELKRFYAAGDIALMPFPYTRHYAFFMSPLKLFEYLMSGLPIVASDLPSIREILSEEEAYLPEPGSVSALIQALRHVLGNPEEAQQKAIRSKALASWYTWGARAERIATRLEALVSVC